jgi:hypothetical protein
MAAAVMAKTSWIDSAIVAYYMIVTIVKVANAKYGLTGKRLPPMTSAQ